jgi:hypothetical protein
MRRATARGLETSEEDAGDGQEGEDMDRGRSTGSEDVTAL